MSKRNSRRSDIRGILVWLQSGQRNHFLLQSAKTGSYLVGICFRGQSGGSMKLTTDPPIVPSLRRSGALPQIPIRVHGVYRNNFTLLASPYSLVQNVVAWHQLLLCCTKLYKGCTTSFLIPHTTVLVSIHQSYTSWTILQPEHFSSLPISLSIQYSLIILPVDAVWYTMATVSNT